MLRHQRSRLSIAIQRDHVGVCGLLAYMRDEKDEDRIAEAGFSHVRSTVNDPHTLDRIYGKGLSYSPTVQTDTASARLLLKQGVPPEQWRQLWWQPDGKPKWVEEENPSPFSPAAQQAEREAIRACVAPLAGHPAFKYLCLYDESMIRLDVSPSALAYFKSKTGLEPPDFRPRPMGTIVADNDPYARWIDTFGMDFWMNQRKPIWPLLGWYNTPGMPAINQSLALRQDGERRGEGRRRSKGRRESRQVTVCD